MMLMKSLCNNTGRYVLLLKTKKSGRKCGTRNFCIYFCFLSSIFKFNYLKGKMKAAEGKMVIARGWGRREWRREVSVWWVEFQFGKVKKFWR